MRTVVRCLVLLLVVGLLAVPTHAAEMRVTGFFDNVFPRFDINTSSIDSDPTRNDDRITFGRSRARLFFNFIASDDLRGVFGLEIDQSYGTPSANRLGSGCVTGTGAYANELCGFRQGTDTNSIEVKHMYVDFRVPQIPIGNRWRLGGFPLNVTPLHPLTIYTMDVGGGDLTVNLTDWASVMVYYAQLEEDLDRFPGSAKIGEDYSTGMTLQLRPVTGLDLHLLGLYGHLQRPFGGNITGGGGPFNLVASDSLNVNTESRWYFGFDSRYRIGNTSIEPGFTYLLGRREFTGESAALTGASKVNYDAFQGFLKVVHTTGPWLLGAKFAYASGDKADADINNRGIGSRSNVKGFRYMGVDTSHWFGEWFEIHGRSDVDATGNRSFRRMAEVAKLERFGWMMAGAHIEYRLTDRMILTGSGGGFWTAEKTGCPAVHVTAAGVCAGPLNSSGEPALNFTGDSRWVGWEVNAGFRYTIMPGLTWTPLIAYADYGDALEVNNRKALDAWAFTNRIIYIF